MSKALYIAASANNNLMWAQAQTAHNSANSLTPGYKASKPSHKQLPVYNEGFPSTVYSATYNAGYKLDHGSVNHTEDNRHAYIQGDGWFSVDSGNGEEAYTRRGDFQVDQLGNLLTGDGYKLLGQGGGPIVLPPHKQLTFSNNGGVLIEPVDGGPMQEIDILKLVNPNSEEMEKGSDGLFKAADGLPLNPAQEVKVQAGGYEESNVNYMDCMLDMINYSRSIESINQIIKEQDQSEKLANKLLSL